MIQNKMMLYVHIPFCVKKCAYCDFLSAPASKEIWEAYTEAVLKEIAALKAEKDRMVSSLLFGGGTPSVIEAGQIGRILDALRNKFLFSADAEISMEANPGTLTGEKLDSYREHGINRISLGLQSAVNEELKMLGRIHTYEEFQKSYQLVRKAGFSNVNVDLMFAIPEQTYETWIHNLLTVARLQPEHISAYSLIVEEGTPFYERRLNLPDEDTEYRMYEDIAGILQPYGYRQYEISNYAREGFACRHNMGYWDGTDYLGIGLGASSLYEGRRFSNTEDMQTYLKCSGDLENIREQVQVLSEQEKMQEFMFLGLRMTEGISEKEFQKRFHISLEEKYGKVLKKYQAMGFLEYGHGQWYFSRKGIHVSNQILADFLE